MPVVRITDLVQGSPWYFKLDWSSNTPVITLAPADYYAVFTVAQYAELTAGDETNLTFKDAKVLQTFSTDGPHLDLYPGYVDITVPRTMSAKWVLQALQDAITRTLSGVPEQVEIAYPKQLLHAQLQILRRDGKASVFPEPFELELEVEARIYA